MNLKQVEELLVLMKTYGADSVKIEDKDTSISVKMTPRQGRPAQSAPGEGGVVHPPVGANAQTTADSQTAAVLSPTVGVFYTAPGPEELPFVQVGDHVDKDTILCIIEAMKVMNEIPAGVSGTVTAILPVNGDRVEYEQTLVLIRADS